MGALEAGRLRARGWLPGHRGEAGGLGTEAPQRPGSAHPGNAGWWELCPSAHLRQPRPRWLSWSWARQERALLTEETVEAPRVMRMRPLSSNRAVLL